MPRTDGTSPTPSWEARALSSPEWGGRCLLDSYRLVRRIQSGCELTNEMCRRQRQVIAEQREFLKGLRQTLTSVQHGGAAAGETERGFDGGARAVE